MSILICCCCCCCYHCLAYYRPPVSFGRMSVRDTKTTQTSSFWRRKGYWRGRERETPTETTGCSMFQTIDKTMVNPPSDLFSSFGCLCLCLLSRTEQVVALDKSEHQEGKDHNPPRKLTSAACRHINVNRGHVLSLVWMDAKCHLFRKMRARRKEEGASRDIRAM